MHLIIDDQRQACLRLIQLLTECGVPPAGLHYETDPFRALETIGQNHFELIFLDIEMPRMDGLTLWRELKERECLSHIICTTAHDQYAIEALRQQAVDYLLKPVQLEELATALERSQKQWGLQERDFQKLLHHGLTSRQVEVAKRIFEGKTSAEIGEELFLSKHTVDTHRRDILRQTGCHNTTELFAYYECPAGPNKSDSHPGDAGNRITADPSAFP
ncbi:MAG: response regulator transcription factor [Owenweeksia sp.]|nr:response regulator transcription factor [Owenweeksia sp.]